MTKEDIIATLEMAADSGESFVLPQEVRQAMTGYPKPLELVEAVLDFIGTHPDTDFGKPGELVHFVEHFSGRGYEELLAASVQRAPTAHNIWMLHRCYHAPGDSRHDTYRELILALRQADTTPEAVQQAISSLYWD